MIIYQLNPLHGKHICYNSVEATYNNTKGWKTVTEAEFYAEYKKPEVVAPEAIAPDFNSRYEAKFGKKPHHRMLPESIEAAVKEDDANVG